ncbi:MAG: glycosyltransferase family 2 protein [Woeseiaceae bacterium]|nr:glycosyltransferase family 2 protein [Woeseiaceae bacterium]
MQVSIVTVCFNSAATIRDAIDSVLAQSHPDVEYIIIDGGSTDDTMKIVSEYEDRIATVVSEPDQGIYDAMNKGIRAATGDIVGILNSDDFFASKDVVADVVQAFRENEEAGIVFGDVVFVSPEDLNYVKRYYSSRHFKPWKLRFGYMPPHPATFVRRDLYTRYGEYNLEFRIAADYEMYVRWLIRNEVRFRRIDEVLVRMRLGGISTAGLRSSMVLNREIVRACVDNGLYTNFFCMLPKIPFKLFELVRRPPRAA